MPLIGSRKKSVDELEEELEHLKLEGEVLSEQASIAERKAIISQLRKQYGTDWKKILGVGSFPSLSTLRGFLKDSRESLKKWA